MLRLGLSEWGWMMSRKQVNVSISISMKSLTNLYQYLDDHEDDIANNINDFGKLWDIYTDIFGGFPFSKEFHPPPDPPEPPPIRILGPGA